MEIIDQDNVLELLQTPSIKIKEEETSNQNIEHKNHIDNDEISIGAIVSNLAHPYTSKNTNVFITTYAHFIPPLMVVIEKSFGVAKNKAKTERKRESDSYRCLYYSTIGGGFEMNWFRGSEIKKINDGDDKLHNETRGLSIEQLENMLIGKMLILSNVDFELGKKKMWSNNEEDNSKLRVNNLLDYLPPLCSVIDVKYNNEYQKSNKIGETTHLKSKVLVKLRWLNNLTAKYSEEYIPIVSLKSVNEELSLMDFSINNHYLIDKESILEEDEATVFQKIPVKFIDVIWKHYFYEYRFKNLFNHEILNYTRSNSFDNVDLKHILDVSDFLQSSLKFFKIEKKGTLKGKWIEIQYSDKSERYSRRIIRIEDILSESQDGNTEVLYLKAHCLLRNGNIRHFRVSRIKGYRELSKDFVTVFVGNTETDLE